jgi:hypothetical protein
MYRLLREDMNYGDLEVTGDLTVDGNITSDGYILGKKVGVFVYALDQETIIADVDTWTVTGGAKVIPIIEDFSGAVTYTPGVKYDGIPTQTFKIDWAVSYEMNKSATQIHFGIFKNGALIIGSSMQTYGLNINQPYNLAGHVVTEMVTGDELQLVVQATKTGTLTILHETTTISEFFD